MEINSRYKQALQVQIREAYGRVVYTYTTHLKMMNRLVKRIILLSIFKLHFQQYQLADSLAQLSQVKQL